MSRRERLATFRCAEPGCTATTSWAYTSSSEYAEIHDDQRRSPYRCTRHREPDKVLRPDNLTTVGVLVSVRSSHNTAYWAAEGKTTGSGIEDGPGFIAHAADFPAGTQARD